MEPIALPDYVQAHFDPASGQAQHRQLYAVIQKGIRDGALAAGTRLPPTRALAEALGIARNTIVHVYEQLALEGFVRAGVGRGTYVAPQAPRLAPAVARQRRAATLSGRGRQLLAGASASPQQWGAFVPGVPEVRLFPTAVWNRLQARAWRRPTPEQMSYATAGGDATLRQAIADYLKGTRGVDCAPGQVVVTSGTQQSLQLIAQLLADPGDAVWLEDPGYWGARSVFRNAGLKLVPIDVDEEGAAPTPKQLREPPRLMFVSPSHQYPVGALMSHGRRRQLLDYAAAQGVWMIEDDYDSEFRYDARPLPALQGLDAAGHTIYLGTFSKTLFPSLRIAYLVLPVELAEGFARALSELFREGQTLPQSVLASFIAEGHYASHIRRMRGVYSARRAALIGAIRRHFDEAELPILGGDAGLHLVLGLPPHVDDAAVVREALRAGIATRPLSMYSIREPAPRKGLVLGYGAVTEEEIVPAFARLAKVIRKALP
ncbi:PLP-dependent aminotransferase family protein [Pelomonas sp. KK5]|uniref:MocR-like pyridoxine biosynthesis transcription factor PdxR n=1 Tax=Pelomonas sp. KK5 TaxID=1855730 RepID=UPI00097C2EA9|nr:PLP-dependent aminotransferase family protein [Pelomonas sp. KK5]